MRGTQAIVIAIGTLSLPAQDMQSLILEKETALGRQLAADFAREITPVDSENVRSYVERLAQKIAAQMLDSQFPFRFTVVAEDTCNSTHEPAALPGGYIFVSASLFVAAQDESELAGMVAHAMAHIAKRHGMKQATRGESTNTASTPLIFMGGWAGSCTEAVTVPQAFLASQRSNEAEADVLAVQAMSRAGFDPSALLRYLSRVQLRSDNRDRLDNLRSAVDALAPLTNASASSAEFDTAQEAMRNAVVSERPRNVPTLRRK